ncbi:hypothetical protein ACFL1S_04035 [Pseudomonadota bacterium]
MRVSAAYSRYAVVVAACRRADVSRMAWNRWKITYPWFDRAVADKHADIGNELESSAIQQAKAGDTRLMIALLKRFKPAEYSEKYEQRTYQYDPADTPKKAHAKA